MQETDRVIISGAARDVLSGHPIFRTMLERTPADIHMWNGMCPIFRVLGIGRAAQPAAPGCSTHLGGICDASRGAVGLCSVYLMTPNGGRENCAGLIAIKLAGSHPA